ncbi:HSP20 family protein [Deinobacterium chartae]|uniref:HSP20 family protein n=1 Tax=Deinobacterium chartae TaxID=521158 RepID=A0A841HVP1_9DEIO|nr:HSP20 family protein [Deinobacterium chartae]
MNELSLERLNTLMKLRQEVENLEVGGPWSPAADWLETDTHLILLMDLPGVDPESLEVEESEEGLTLAGAREQLDLEGEVLGRERPQGSFTRSLELPREIVPGSGEARLRNGVLVLRLEKRHKTINAG